MMNKPILDGRAWFGTENYLGSGLTVEIVESKKRPGFYFYALLCRPDELRQISEQPVKAESLLPVIDDFLKRKYGFSTNEMEWRVEDDPSELAALGERFKAGD